MRAGLSSWVLAAMLPAATYAAPAPSPTIYVIDYVDVLASTASRAATVLKQYRNATRIESGAVGVDVYRQTGRSSGFAIVEAWRDGAAFEGHAKAAATVELARDLKPIQLAPPDVRVHTAYSVGSPVARRQSVVMLLVHVDVIPTSVSDYERVAKSYIESSRREAGLSRLDILQAISPHTNHFTVIESWVDAQALQAHEKTVTSRAYREDLAPMLGALYDERAYKKIE
jgi:quinol monooxygenase YgiN